MGRVTGKRALITAAGAGIGLATALMLSREGATVWASDVDPGKLAMLNRQNGNIRTVALDVLNEKEITSWPSIWAPLTCSSIAPAMSPPVRYWIAAKRIGTSASN